MNTHCICIAVKLQIFFSSRTNGFTIEQLTITETIFLPLDFFFTSGYPNLFICHSNHTINYFEA
jgi:hypothetical protein